MGGESAERRSHSEPGDSRAYRSGFPSSGCSSTLIRRPNGRLPPSAARHWPLYLGCGYCQSFGLELAARWALVGFVRVPVAAVPAGKAASPKPTASPGSVSVLSTCSSKKTRVGICAGSSFMPNSAKAKLLVVRGAFHGFDLLVPGRRGYPNRSARVGSLRCAKHSPLAKLFSEGAGRCRGEVQGRCRSAA